MSTNREGFVLLGEEEREIGVHVCVCVSLCVPMCVCLCGDGGGGVMGFEVLACTSNEL